MIEVRKLCKTYHSGLLSKKSHQAVRDISFRVEPGETLGLVGESGCGKSTLSLMLCRLLKPSSGEILLEGREVSHLRGKEVKAYHKEVQIIFQNPETALDPNMKIRDSILEAIRNYRLAPPRSEAEQALMSGVIDMVGLQQEHLDRYPWELSGGQIQRAVLARVIALRPKVLIADEPTSMLDVSVQAQILSLIRNLQKELNFAMIFVSHDLDVVRHVADRVLVIHKGQEVETGCVADVFDHPREDYTKSLLGAFYGEAAYLT